MGEKRDEKEIVNFEELLIANVIQTDTIAQLLVEEGVFTEQEFFTRLINGATHL